jgi:hypothetical protein
MPPELVFELVCKRYFDKSNTREVNYVKFCKDVDRPGDMFAQVKEPEAAPLVRPSGTKSNFFASTT